MISPKSNINVFMTIIFVFFGLFGGVSILLEPIFEEWPNTVLVPLGIFWFFLSILMMYWGWVVISTFQTRSYIFVSLKTNVSWDESRYLRILIGCLGKSDPQLLSVQDMNEELRKSYLLALAARITGNVYRPISLFTSKHVYAKISNALENEIQAKMVNMESEKAEKLCQTTRTTTEKLRELKDMKGEGLLTEDEYAAKRQTLVDQLGK